MSAVLALVGDDHAAVAGDAVSVNLGGTVSVRTGYAKVFAGRDRIGAISGVVSFGDEGLGPVLARCLRDAPSPRAVFPLFLRQAEDDLRKGAETWRELIGEDALAPFAAFVAGFDPGRRRLEAYQMVVEPSTRFETDVVAPGGDLAHGVLYGTYDAELARWSTRYRLEHEVAAYTLDRPGPAPRSVAVGSSAAALQDAAATALAAAVEREPLFPRPAWWPAGVPVSSPAPCRPLRYETARLVSATRRPVAPSPRPPRPGRTARRTSALAPAQRRVPSVECPASTAQRRVPRRLSEPRGPAQSR